MKCHGWDSEMRSVLGSLSSPRDPYSDNSAEEMRVERGVSLRSGGREIVDRRPEEKGFGTPRECQNISEAVQYVFFPLRFSKRGERWCLSIRWRGYLRSNKGDFCNVKFSQTVTKR